MAIEGAPEQEEHLPEAQHEGAQEGGQHEQPQEREPAPQDDADFLAGFAAASGGESEPEPAPEPPKHFGKYTDAEMLDQLAELERLREQQSKVFGTLGSLKQSIDQLRNQPQAAAPRLNAQLKRLSAEYPEMAAMLQEDLADVQGGGAQAQDVGAIERMVTERLEEAGRTSEKKLLSVMHPDWREVAQAQEFAQWKGTLSPDELQVVNDSWDAITLGDSLTKFKAWKAQASKNKQSRQSRLESAITPRGTRQTAPTQADSDPFMAGFSSVRAAK